MILLKSNFTIIMWQRKVEEKGMKNKKLVLVFALLLGFVLIASGCGPGGIKQTRKVEPRTVTLPKEFPQYPGSAMENRNYYFAGDVKEAPDQESDYVIIFYNVSATLEDVYNFYIDKVDVTDTAVDDNMAYIDVGNDRIDLHERRTTSFTSIKYYIHVNDYLAAKGE